LYWQVEEVVKMMETELGSGWIYHKSCKVISIDFYLIISEASVFWFCCMRFFEDSWIAIYFFFKFYLILFRFPVIDDKDLNFVNVP
jgi:hypothetical protein